MKKALENRDFIVYRSIPDYIQNNRSSRLYLFLGLFVSVVQFGIFKYCYPFPSFINGDSYVYITMASSNPKIGTYPIGYPMFLRLFSVFSKSDLVLVCFQYALLQCGFLYFILSIFSCFEVTKFTRVLFFVLFMINPVSWYLANMVSSDALFLSLSIIWFTQLIWMVYSYHKGLILFNSIVLFILFTIRYNALYYPLISIAALFLNRAYIAKRVGGILISIFLIALFIQYTSKDYKRLSGVYQFSPFSGWQLANNALYAYRYVDSFHLKKLPKKFDSIDKMVRHYFDTTKDTKKYPSEMLVASTVYMWDPRSPLSIYADSLVAKDSTVGPLKKWSKAAPMMKEYGTQLIKTYPKEFVTHYILPNSLKYYVPPIEFLETYNMGLDTVNPIAEEWFNYKTNKVYTRFKDKETYILNYYPILVAVMNVLIVLNILSFIGLRLQKRFPNIKKYLLLVGILWSINFCFSVFASPIALRFQLFPIIVSLSLVIILMECLVVVSFEKHDVSTVIN